MLGRSPIWNLTAIQEQIKSGELDLSNDQHVWMGTRRCEDKLQILRWTLKTEVKNLILLLRPEHVSKGGDLINAQWDEDDSGVWNLCDSYKVRVDDVTWTRNPRAPMYYVKFGMNHPGAPLYLVLISCHLEAPY